jgi:C-terminal processing protease CtpA/Prc
VRAWTLWLIVAACSAPPRRIEHDLDVVAAEPEPGPEVKATADAIVKAYQLVTVESAVPGDPAKVRAAAVAALGWTAPVAWTSDDATDRQRLRDTVRALAQKGELPRDAVLRAARAMALAAGDAQTFAIPKPALQALFGVIDGRAVVQPGLAAHELDDGTWAASDVFAGGPAAVAGVRRGDVLVSLDGAPIEHGYIDFVPLFGAPLGTRARLAIRRGGIERTLVLQLAPVVTPIFTWRVLADDVAYVGIGSCTHSDDPARDAAAQLQHALIELDRKKVKRLVIDLRGNAGGFPFDLASLLVDADPLMYGVIGEGESEQPVARTKLTAWKTRLPIGVLVDESTAAGAEMIALALRDHAGAVIVGRPTAGGLTFPTTEKLAGDVTLSYPLSRVGSAKTKATLDGNRLVPDIAVPNATADDYAAGKDPQLDAAIAALAMRGAP